MVCLRPDSRKIDPGYLALALLKPATRRFLNQRTTGMAESQVNFENQVLLNTPLWLPSRAEQERVTESLNDVGALIASLGQLIAKKRGVKQGLMQQLLTGRTRLPGFGTEWEQSSLGAVARVVGDDLVDPHLDTTGTAQVTRQATRLSQGLSHRRKHQARQDGNNGHHAKDFNQ